VYDPVAPATDHQVVCLVGTRIRGRQVSDRIKCLVDRRPKRIGHKAGCRGVPQLDERAAVGEFIAAQ